MDGEGVGGCSWRGVEGRGWGYSWGGGGREGEEEYYNISEVLKRGKVFL